MRVGRWLGGISLGAIIRCRRRVDLLPGSLEMVSFPLMCRSLRWAFNGLAAVSAVLFVAVLAASQASGDFVIWGHKASGRSGVPRGGSLSIQNKAVHYVLTDSTSMDDCPTWFPSNRLSTVNKPMLPDRLDAGFGWEYGSETGPNPSQVQFLISRDIWVPLWLVVSLCAILPGAFAIDLCLRKVLSRGRTQDGICARCGYDLRATAERCPECGTAVSIINGDNNRRAC